MTLALVTTILNSHSHNISFFSNCYFTVSHNIILHTLSQLLFFQQLGKSFRIIEKVWYMTTCFYTKIILSKHSSKDSSQRRPLLGSVLSSHFNALLPASLVFQPWAQSILIQAKVITRLQQTPVMILRFGTILSGRFARLGLDHCVWKSESWYFNSWQLAGIKWFPKHGS